MPVQRNQQAANLPAANQVGSVQVQGPRTGIAGTYQQPAPTDSFLSTSLQGVLSTASKFAAKAVQNDAEAAYLNGARAAQTGESLESLDSNIFTREFQSVGFHDVSKRLEQTKVNTGILANMPKLRKLTPEEFRAAVIKEAGSLFDDTAGMSGKAKRASLEQQVSAEDTLFKTYTAERSKYIIEQIGSEHVARAHTVVKALQAATATGDTDAMASGIGSTLVWAKGVLSDEGLPDDIKQEQITGMVDLLASTNATLAITTLLDSDLVKGMPIDKLDSMYSKLRESQNRTKAVDNNEFMTGYGAFWAGLENGQAKTFDELQAYLQEGSRRGIFTAKDTSSAIEKFNREIMAGSRKEGSALAFANGDANFFATSGIDYRDGAKSRYQAMAKQSGVSSAVLDMVGIGARHGFKEAFDVAGSEMNRVMTALGGTDELSPDAAELVTDLVDGLILMEQSGDNVATSQLMASMNDRSKTMLASIVGAVGEGQSVEQAAKNFVKQEADYAMLSPGEKQIMANRQSEADAELVDSLLNASAGSALKSYFGQLFSEQRKVRGLIDLGDSPEGYDARMRDLFGSALVQEVHYARRSNAYLSTAAIEKQAIAGLTARTVLVGETAAILPRNVTAGQIVGDKTVTNRVLGEAIEQAIPPAPGGFSPVLTIGRDGTVMVDYMDSEGIQAPGASRELDPAQLRAWVRERDVERSTRGKELRGEGAYMGVYTYPGGNTAPFNVNGVNGAGVAEEAMLEARKQLVKFEGIKAVPYSDGAPGRSSVGVGIHETSDFYPESAKQGKPVPLEEVRDSFMKHSDMTAKALRTKVAPSLGWHDPAGPQFQFLMQMGYQAGAGWPWNKDAPVYGQLADAIRNRDVDAAQKALLKTPAYTKSGPARQRYYIKTLTESFNAN